MTRHLALAVLLGIPRLALAQDSLESPDHHGSAIGITVDRFSYQHEALPTFTLHVSSLRPHHLMPEFGLGVFPEALGEGYFAGNVDLGGGVAFPITGGVLMLRGGATGRLAAGDGGGGALPAVHYGASILGGGSNSRIGIRIDLLVRTYLAFGGRHLTTLSIGAGLTSLPK